MKSYNTCFAIFIFSYFLTFPYDMANAQKTAAPSYSWYKNYDINYYKLDIEACDTNRFISGSTSMTCIAKTSLDTLYLEMGDHLIIDSLFCDHEKLRFKRNNGILAIIFQQAVNKGTSHSTCIYYHGLVPSGDFFAALTSRTDMEWVIPVTWTLSEAFASKNWFPCKQDLMDKIDSTTIFITVPKNCKAGSNGLLTKVTPIGTSKMRYEWKTHYPMAYYLISFAVADYEDYSFYVKLKDKDSVLLQNYIYNRSGYLAKNKSAIDKTGPVMAYYSSIFGRYPFIKEKYGHCLAPIYGGMENQTMTTLQSFEFSLFTHEMAHQWFGDYVTCASWQDVWLNEGFASYAEYLALDKFDSPTAAQNWMTVAHNYALQDTGGSIYVPADQITDENRIFSMPLTYKKGASVIHQLRYEINNDSLFFKILCTYLDTYKDSIATGNDFVNIVNRLTKSDFTGFFNQWYYGHGYPVFSVQWTQKKNFVLVSIIQKSSSKRTPLFKMHLDLQVNYENGDESTRIYIDKPVQSFKIPVKKEVKAVNLDPDNWYLKKIK